MLESLSGRRRREIQEDGIVMKVKNFKCFRRSWRETNCCKGSCSRIRILKDIGWGDGLANQEGRR